VEFPLSLMNKNMINMTYLYYFILVWLCWKLLVYWNTLESIPGTNQY
jgi:hypothetical protein